MSKTVNQFRLIITVIATRCIKNRMLLNILTGTIVLVFRPYTFKDVWQLLKYARPISKLVQYHTMSTSQPADPQTGVSNPVYSVHLTTEINAPFETVWEVLTVLPKYHEW